MVVDKERIWTRHSPRGFLEYVTAMRFGRCIAPGKKLDSKVWNDCAESVSVASYAANIICTLFSNILGLTVWILKEDFVSRTLC